MDPRKRILVPVDFAPPSLRACERAIALCRDLRAELTLLHVVDVPEYTLLLDGFVQLRAGAERTMSALANRLRPAVPELETRIVEGAPWHSIISTIETERPDIVVCGTHNRRGLAHLALGSVAERMVRASTAPVLSIPGYAFESREEAGGRLMMELPRHDLPGSLAIVALGSGSVPTADVIARKLGAPLDLWEYVPVEVGGSIVGAMGEDELAYYDAPRHDPVAVHEQAEARAKALLREQLGYVRGTRPFGDVLDRLIVLVAEHVTTPAPVLAAVRAMRPLGASGIVLVTPVASSAALSEIRPLVDGIVCLEQTLVANPAEIAFRESSPPSHRKVRRLLGAWRAEDAPVPFPTRHAS
jgi:nucleotide-binding universal stress UspA family protein/predicted phosphoribosyltransferase